MSGGRRGRLAASALSALGALALAGCSITTSVAGSGHGFRDDRRDIAVVTTQLGGKNVFVPSTIVVTEGKGQRLSFYNSTDTPHGMAIPGLGIQAILPSREEYVVTLPALAGGNVYQVNCHLHPPHRTATLVVLPAR